MEFDVLFPSPSTTISFLFVLYYLIKICLSYHTESMEFIRLEELYSPTVVRGIEGEEEIVW